MFSIASRYHGIQTARHKMRDGRHVMYLRRRFVPSPERFESLTEHTVTEGDRLDNIAAQYLGAPDQFWRICDANHAFAPEELTERIGRRLRITLPEGIPANRHA